MRNFWKKKGRHTTINVIECRPEICWSEKCWSEKSWSGKKTGVEILELKNKLGLKKQEWEIQNSWSGKNRSRKIPEWEKEKSQQHPKDFPSGHPPQYYPGLATVNFGVRMGSGTFDAVWPLTRM